MKKSSIKKIVVIALTILILLVIVILLKSQPQQETVPAFKFLSGRGTFIRIEDDKSIIKKTRFVYSFETDFDSFLADVNSELLPLGYRQIPPVPQSYVLEYILSGGKPMEVISVYITKNHKMNVYSTPKSSDYQTPTRYEYSWKDGWVSVEVIQRQKQNWLIAIAKSAYRKLRGSEE
jgi:hypothetical protein